jgi:hypothetical protein
MTTKRAQCRSISGNVIDLNSVPTEDLPCLLGLAVCNFLDVLERDGISSEDRRNRIAGVSQFIFTLGWSKGYGEGMDDFENYGDEELCPDCRREQAK